MRREVKKETDGIGMNDLIKIEKGILEFWEKNNIYHKLKSKLSQGPPFYFCDGPPYATGQIHPGTAWNKCLKDCIIRQKRFLGMNVRDTPGYDTHGLPIEVKVEQKLKLSNKKEIETKIGVEKFVRECRKFASHFTGVISEQFKVLGVWMDWENPYLTFENSYIEASWRTIAAAESKGLLAEGVYVVPHCGRCETTLANYELEYGIEEDPQIYVKFKVKGTDNEYLIIWTTTPWTLISNMAVMAHPTFEYVKVKVGDEIWILAKARLDNLMSLLENESATVIGELSGKKLDSLEYEHPLQKKIQKKYNRKVVISDEFVSGEDGSGLVHCAPGHGPEDYIIGKRYEIEIFSPVDSAGKFTKQAGRYSGKRVREANVEIIKDLEQAGALVHKSKITHRYPHCWRCKTPLVYISTNQWFIDISKVKARMLEEIDTGCRFQPDFAKRRFRDFVESAPNWCISRQRYWGIPLPIWVCKKCKQRKVIADASEFPEKSIDLHRPTVDSIVFKCKCGGKMHRVPDILDVWFDSGNSVWAQLKPGETWGNGGVYADFIVEGKDQIRGWFYSLLGSGIVLNNEIPYKNLLMHGFFVDEKGEKLSKSVGNFVPLDEIISKNGSDSFRLWSLSSVAWDDLKFSWRELSENSRTLGIFYNLSVWMERFYPKGKKIELNEKELEIEDKWLLSRCETVREKVSSAFDSYTPSFGLVALREFLVEDVSRFYLKRLKQRLNQGRSTEEGLATIYHVLLRCCIMLSPYVPFITEHIYQKVFREIEKGESITLLAWPSPIPLHKDQLLEQQMSVIRKIIIASANARSSADLKLRWPVEEILIWTESTEVSNAIEKLSNILESSANARRVSVTDSKESSKFEVKINKSKIGEKFKEESGKVLELLNSMPKEQLIENARGQKTWLLDGNFGIERGMVEVSEIREGYAVADFDGGTIYVKTDLSPSLYREAMAREIIRRIQSMRKELALVESDPIQIWITGKKDLVDMAKKEEKLIITTANASKLHTSKPTKEKALEKEWEIEGMKITISILPEK